MKSTNKLLMIAMAIMCLTFGAKSQISPMRCESNETSYNLPCMKQELDLVGTKILIKVYTKPKAGRIINRTFVVVHNNEEKGLDAAKKVISESYGRLVEVVSNYDENSNKLNQTDISARNQRRYLYFENGKYCIDPNRIYTTRGIQEKLSICETIPNDKINSIKAFGQRLISIVTKNNEHKFIIGVHNNTNDGGLTLNSYQENSSNREDSQTAVGVFKANNHLDKKVVDFDDFILVSDILLFVKVFEFERNFNIALQENKRYLDAHPDIDDGSMSIYFGKKVLRASNGKIFPFRYMNIEAEGKDNNDGKQKQRQMEAIELVIEMKL